MTDLRLSDSWGHGVINGKLKDAGYIHCLMKDGISP